MEACSSQLNCRVLHAMTRCHYWSWLSGKMQTMSLVGILSEFVDVVVKPLFADPTQVESKKTKQIQWPVLSIKGVIPCEINKYLEKWLHHHLRLTKKKLL